MSLMCRIFSNRVVIFVVLVCASQATKEKQQVTRKKPLAVTDPHNMRTFEDWINLEREVLENSYKAVKLPSDGSLTEMARSLQNSYRQLNTPGYLGKGA